MNVKKGRFCRAFAIAVFVFIPFMSNAQKSCSFVTHVSNVNGKDSTTCGSENTPCASIQYGINRAKITGDTLLRIAAGHYTETIELANGISLWGGFDNNWNFNGTTTISGVKATNGEYYAVRAENFSKKTILSDLTIIAPDAIDAGKSSYGLHGFNCSDLVFQRIIFKGGKGSNGTNGVDGNDATVQAVIGSNGGDAKEYSVSCDNTNSGSGGSGAVTPGYSSTAGGKGGRGGFMDTDCNPFGPDYNATPGINGNNAVQTGPNNAGYGGFGSSPCADGFAGNPGRTNHGHGGNSAKDTDIIVSNFWVSNNGSDGTIGLDGTGGGGGGGAGGCDYLTDAYGAGGGGGGSGGIASTKGGTGGMSGGHSFAVILYSSSAKFMDCKIFIGQGGAGGNGGKSGKGTLGGKGGKGGLGISSVDGGPGGNGGDGGDGGNSGGGGGGSGGDAIGIYGINSNIYRSGNEMEGGLAGNFGLGGIGSPDSLTGKDGISGIVFSLAGKIQDTIIPKTYIQDPCNLFLNTEKITQKYSLEVFPNPSPDGMVSITNNRLQNASVFVYEMTGKLMLHQQIPAQKTGSVLIQGNGLFYVCLKYSNGEIQTKKVWVE